MDTVHLTTSCLYLLGSIVALIIVATWPPVRGKGWLMGALSIWVVTGIYLRSMYVAGYLFGRPEANSIWRSINWASQFANVVGAILLVTAVFQLREYLNGRLQSKPTFRRGAFQSAPLIAGIAVCLGMSLPWAHVGRHWVSGWSTSANILGIHLPGILVAIAAGIAIGALMSKSGDSNRSHWVSLTLCGYGLAHSIFMAFALLNTPGMNMGAGVLVTVISLIALSFCCLSFKSAEHTATVDATVTA